MKTHQIIFLKHKTKLVTKSWPLKLSGFIYKDKSIILLNDNLSEFANVNFLA